MVVDFDISSVVEVCDYNDKKVRCLVKKANGVLCGDVIGNVPYTIRRHCTNVHKMDLTLRSDKGGPFTNREEYIRDCTTLTVLQNLPLSYWHSEHVRARERRLQSGFDVNVSDIIIKKDLGLAFGDMMQKVGETLGRSMFSLKFDMATRKDRHILGISAQYIEDWRIKIRHIGMTSMVGKSTGIAIKDGIEEALNDINVDPCRVYSTTTDSGTNVLLAARVMLGEIDAACSQPMTEIAVSTALETVEELDDDPVSAADGDDEQESDEEDIDEAAALEFVMDDNEEEEHQVDLQDRVDRDMAPIIVPDVPYFNDTKCAAHIVQNGVNDFINRRTTKINQVKYYVKKVRTSMDYKPRNLRPAKPTLASTTRWSSTYRMVS